MSERTAYQYRYRMPVKGTEALQPVAVPSGRRRKRAEGAKADRKIKMTTSRTRANRNRAMAMDRGFATFLIGISVVCVVLCIWYLRMRSTATAQLEENNQLSSQLTTLKSENDALYENITNSVDLEHIRDVAMNELGMKYADEDQIIWYHTEGSDYVRQYQEVPSGD